MTYKPSFNSRFGVILFGVLAAIMITPEAFGQSSLGIGRNQETLPTGSFFQEYFVWIRDQQAVFHQMMRSVLIELRAGNGYVWPLIWICFLYGVFHAIGPGHGKVVISSYMFANEATLKRGIGISMAASILQGMTAITAITVFLIVLRGTGLKTGEMTYALEIGSYFGVMAVGLWMLWRRTIGRSKHNVDHHDHHHHGHDHSHLGADEVCDHCGHAHAPDPQTLTGKFGLKEAWAAILAVGLRPCTGALIVLIFCFANGLYITGVLATLAMSIGTGIAVSSMAMIAVTMKTLALRFAVAQSSVATATRWVEILGALMIFLIGFVLFTAAAGF